MDIIKQRFTSRLCGICTQSHGVRRCRLDLEVLKFQLIMTDGVVVMVGHIIKWKAVVILDSSEGSVKEAGGGIRGAIYSPWCHVKHVLVMKSGVNNLLIHDRNIPPDLTLTSLYEHSVLFSCNRKMAFSRPLPGSGIFNTRKFQGLVPWNKNAQRSNTAGNQLLKSSAALQCDLWSRGTYFYKPI